MPFGIALIAITIVITLAIVIAITLSKLNLLFSIPQVMEEMRAEVASSKQLESKLLQALVPRK